MRLDDTKTTFAAADHGSKLKMGFSKLVKSENEIKSQKQQIGDLKYDIDVNESDLVEHYRAFFDQVSESMGHLEFYQFVEEAGTSAKPKDVIEPATEQPSKDQIALLEMIQAKEKEWTGTLNDMHDIKVRANSVRAEIQQHYKQFSDESQWGTVKIDGDGL